MFDVLIIGGGPGGYTCAIRSAQLGLKVAIAERKHLGGICLNWGCIPTKTILRSAHIVADTRDAATFGLNAAVATVDIPALRARKEAVVDELVGQVESSARRLKVRVVYGTGTLVGPKAVEVALADGGTETVEGDALILATGSAVFKLPSIDHDMPGVWTSDEAVALSEIPKDVVIIGGGVSQVGDILTVPIRQAVRERAMRASEQGVRITTGMLGRRSVLIGATVQAVNVAIHVAAENKNPASKVAVIETMEVN